MKNKKPDTKSNFFNSVYKRLFSKASRPQHDSKVDRRQFLANTAGTSAAAFMANWPLQAMAAEGRMSALGQGDWDPGNVRHLLPTVNDTRMLIKVSLERPLATAPLLSIEGAGSNLRVQGRMTDTAGEFWEFYAEDLSPSTSYQLSLSENNGDSLCESWPLKTFPAPDQNPEQARILFYTCAGGPQGTYNGIADRSGNLPTLIRNRILRRALSFSPDAVVANGDHIYWDLHQWLPNEDIGNLSARGRESNFNFSLGVFNDNNELALKMAVDQQIVPVYGTDFRSTPVFFLQDDHDHWENDHPTTYPVTLFQLELARTTQQMYYPEFLADNNRPKNLPWSANSARGDLSESFGTLRFGNLAEVLLYDVRRTLDVSEHNAVFLDFKVEDWLKQRTASNDTTHLVHAPSNPFGWSAGKWGEWYPDQLDPESNQLSIDIPKPLWRQGWLEQHDRLIQSLTDMRHRSPLVISGDLHAIGAGEILRSGNIDLNDNPVTAILSGPVGTTPGGWPSVARGARSMPSLHLDMVEEVEQIEEHGFTIVDFLQDKIVIRLFKWDVNSQPLDDIDTMEVFHTIELETPA
ncbi:MAG: hypothetical protein P8J61_01420 [Gammaproteobacteria bacterium]|jgi:phosphodiesterase/alkaline phosphatase D-like protein|nr:hypothetical protein [Gammaproteobacteria bacterium]